MKKTMATALLALTFVVGACGGNKVTEAVDDWASKSCACKKRACAEKMKVEFDKLEHNLRGDIEALSKSDEKKVDQDYRRGVRCLSEKFDVHAG